MSGTATGRRRRTFWAAMLMSAVGSVATPAVADATAPWRIIDLGVGDHSSASAINDRGHVVGYHNGRAFLWRDGKVTYLPMQNATDINNRDEVVGSRFGDQGLHAILWRNGVLTELGAVSGETNSHANAINDRGEVVGWTMRAGQGMHGFRWRNGVMTDLGVVPDGFYSSAEDINNAGVVVGTSGGMNAPAVRWLPGRSIQALTEPASAKAVNERGQVTGVHSEGGGPHGFLWQRGQITHIQPPSGGGFLQPWGINNQAQIVGDTALGAFVWQEGQLTLLPPVVCCSSASDINEQGQIVGYSTITTQGPNQRAVLWTRAH